MKIFNVENGHEKVYVQREDIMMLSRLDKSFPEIIYNRILDHGVMIVDKSNQEDFIEFTEPEVIKFFRGEDWLIDYKQFRNLKETDLIVAEQTVVDEMNKLATEYNAYVKDHFNNSSQPKKKNKPEQGTIINDIITFLINSDNEEYQSVGQQISDIVCTACNNEYNNEQLANMMTLACQKITKEMALAISQNTIAINASFSADKLAKYIEDNFNQLLAKKKNADGTISMVELAHGINSDEANQMLLKHELLENKLHSINKILRVKKGSMCLPFPVVPDSDGFKMDGEYDSIDFQLSGALDPYTYLIYRKDLHPMSWLEIIPESLLRSGTEISMIEKIDDDFFMGNFKQDFNLSADQKLFIIHYQLNKVKDKKDKKGIIKALLNRAK